MQTKRKLVKLAYTDTYPGFDFDTSVIKRAILRNFDIEEVKNPDYLIVLPYGHNHLRYDCVKIFCTGENITPDFNLFDYAAGFDNISFGDRYVRTPLYALRDNWSSFRLKRPPSDDELLNRRFCSYVVSNGEADPIRDYFFHRLSKYKMVDSGGRWLNNIGGPVEDKLDFLSKYKFNIAFENSSYPGYTTEKIMDALSVWSIPVYWGNPQIADDFRLDSFINVTSRDEVDRAVEKIIFLDKNDAEYLEKCKSECLVIKDLDYYENRLAAFFKNIFDMPIETVARVSRYGCQGKKYMPTLQEAYAARDKFGLIMHYSKKVSRIFKGA